MICLCECVCAYGLMLCTLFQLTSGAVQCTGSLCFCRDRPFKWRVGAKCEHTRRARLATNWIQVIQPPSTLGTGMSNNRYCPFSILFAFFRISLHENTYNFILGECIQSSKVANHLGNVWWCSMFVAWWTTGMESTHSLTTRMFVTVVRMGRHARICSRTHHRRAGRLGSTRT